MRSRLAMAALETFIVVFYRRRLPLDARMDSLAVLAVVEVALVRAHPLSVASVAGLDRAARALRPGLSRCHASVHPPAGGSTSTGLGRARRRRLECDPTRAPPTAFACASQRHSRRRGRPHLAQLPVRHDRRRVRLHVSTCRPVVPPVPLRVAPRDRAGHEPHRSRAPSTRRACLVGAGASTRSHSPPPWLPCLHLGPSPGRVDLARECDRSGAPAWRARE